MDVTERRYTRRLPVGAEPLPDGSVHFRVWAPKRRSVAVRVARGGEREREAGALEPEADGYFSGTIPGVAPGDRYRFRLDGDGTFPDPASRFQPDGPHGPSQVIDPAAFRWTDRDWPGPRPDGQVVYELHVGTFTREGTWEAAMDELPALAALGVTLLEVMPVADFPGRFGWGYDGVNPYAPTRLYGTPDDFRRFVDRAHRLGLGVLLDAVYNHLGPDGNYLGQYSDAYVTDRYRNEWGEAVNYDGPASGPVREYVIANAGYWIDEFHLDGLRLDATQQIFDASPTHVLAEIGERVRRAAGGRATLLVAEDESQDARLVRPRRHGGHGLDAVWNDDFHHSARVALTGRREAYYSDYRGAAQEFVSLAKRGFLYQGQWYRWQGKRRGTPALDLPPARFVHYLENHDQVANAARGERLHRLTSPGRYRAATALLLLSPQTPLLFQGQEFGASSPFLFFADHEPELARRVRDGRRDFLAQFPSIATPAMREVIADPADPATFARCKLDHAERERNRPILELHRDLLRLRREDPCLAGQRHGAVDGAVLDEPALALRFFAPDGADRLLVVNLGRTILLDVAPEPLLAPPAGMRWSIAWSSEDPRYGGDGTPVLDPADQGGRPSGAASAPDAAPRLLENWRIPGECAVLLVPVPR